MAKGTAKGSIPQKGYGFIQPQAGGKDVFVHISAVERAGLTGLNEGQVVEYEEVANKGKTSAENQGSTLIIAARKSTMPKVATTIPLTANYILDASLCFGLGTQIHRDCWTDNGPTILTPIVFLEDHASRAK